MAKLKTITRKLLRERAALEGKLRAAEVSLRQTDKYAKELASARKAEMASALVQKEQHLQKEAQHLHHQPKESVAEHLEHEKQQSQPVVLEAISTKPPSATNPDQAARRKQRREQRKVHEQVAKLDQLSSGIWTDPDGATVGGATVELLPTAPLVQQLDPKHGGMNRPKPTKPEGTSRVGVAGANLARASLEKPASLQQEQEKEMLARVVDGLTRIGCTNATNDYIVASDEEEAMAKLANARDRVLFAAKEMREADLKVSMVDSLDVGRPQGDHAPVDAEGGDAGAVSHRAPMAEARALRILAQRDFDAAVADEQRAEARLIATKAKALYKIRTPYIAKHDHVNREQKRAAAMEEELWRHKQMVTKVRP